MPFEPGQPKIGGRKEGTQNRATADFKAFWQQFVASAEYRNNLQRRILDGKADHMEKYVAELLHGRPRQEVDMTQSEGIRVLVYAPQPVDMPPALEDHSREEG